MLILNGNVYTIEHGPCDEETDIYVDLIRENGEPYARVLHDGQAGQVIVIRVGQLSLHEKLDQVQIYNTADHVCPGAYFVAVAHALPSNVKAAQVKDFICGESGKAVA